MRGRSNFSQGREGFQDQGRRAEGARAPSHPSGMPSISSGASRLASFPNSEVGIAWLG